MSSRTKTNERGRIRITGFDAESVQRDELFEWQATTLSQSGTGRWSRVWRRFRRNRTALFGLSIIAVMTFVAVFSQPVRLFGVVVQPISLTPYDPSQSHFLAASQSPSLAHPFGTNYSGKDIFSRVMAGARYSLSIGVLAVGLAVLVGVPVGAIAGYYGGWIDEIVMRIIDILYAFPFLVLAIALIAVLGQGYWKMILALVIVGWIGYARLIRGEILSVKENEYVMAARALGARDRSIIFRHIVPNAIAPVIVQATLGIGTIVLAAAALGFLGLGLDPGTSEWGTMLSGSRETLIEGQWWVTVFPGLAIFLFVLSINLVGDGIRDALDPQSELGGEEEFR